MSLCDVWVTPTTAMVVVDTEVAQIAGCGDRRGEASKMLYLPHANIVIAGRGTPMFLNGLHSHMHMLPHASFDAYAEAMPAALQQVASWLQAQLAAIQAQGVTLPADLLNAHREQQLALVGYSHALREMVCLTYESKDDTGLSEGDDVAEWCSPWQASWGESMDVKTPEHARAMATDQIARALEEMPDSAHGGRLLLAELTREDCRFSTLSTVTTRALGVQASGAL